MAYQIKSYDNLVSDMVSWIVANSPSITDLTPGSIIRSYCESASLCLEELYVSVYLGFKRYLNDIQENIFNFERKGGTKAYTNVVFTRTVPNVSVVTIPVGTEVETASGLKFLTTEIATIASMGSNSNSVEVESEEVGSLYNVHGSTITTISGTIDGADTVTNALAATGGVDIETTYQYKKRFQAYIEGLGRSNIAGLVAGALSVDGITSVTVQELFPPVANVNVRLYVDDSSTGGVSVAKIAEVQTVIDGDGTEDNPGYRAAGVNVIVYAPAVVTTDIEVSISLIEGVDSDQVITDVETYLVSYVNNLGVGTDIIYNELVSAVMVVYGVSDCTVTDPTGNISISTSQVGRTGTITVVVA